MSLTIQDLEKIEALLERKLEEKLEEKLEQKLEAKLNQKFDEKLGPNLEKIQKMIDESNALQTQLLFKHFVTKEEFNAAMERLDENINKTSVLEQVVSGNYYMLNVEPIPRFLEDVKILKNRMSKI